MIVIRAPRQYRSTHEKAEDLRTADLQNGMLGEET